MSCRNTNKKHQGEVVEVVRLTKTHFKLGVQLPVEIEVEPGQFFNIKTGGEPAPLWRRPFSVFDQKGEILQFYVQIVGRGTQWLADRKAGECLDLLGPLGHGFEVPEIGELCLLVAGGVGIAPLHFLSKSLDDKGMAQKVFWGGSDRASVTLEPERRSEKFHYATMDGSLGYPGSVVELFSEFVQKNKQAGMVFSCGPEPMLEKVIEVCRAEGLCVQLSFETRMACGWGVCLGCPILVHDEQGQTVYKRVCRDGPVFYASELAR